MKKIILIIFMVLFLLNQVALAQEVSGNIRSLLSTEGRVIFGDEPNSIVVIDYPENIKRIGEYLTMIDNMPQQVLIEARLVEVKLQKEHALGINWVAFAKETYMPLGQFKVGTAVLGDVPGAIRQAISYMNTTYPPTSTQVADNQAPFTLSIFDDNINAVLQTLAGELDTTLLSAPRVTTVNNREAEIRVVQNLPWAEPEVLVSDSGTVTVTWTVKFEEVGISLRVTPTISDDNTISMELHPEVSEKTNDYTLTVQQGTTSIPYTVPVIDRRTASTKVVVGNGQTLIIGGLVKDKVKKGENKIPLLGDIPYLGYLFKSKRDVIDKTELLIFVSPTIITQDEFVKMAKQEKYGIGKGYTDERDKKMRRILIKEASDKFKEDKLSVKVEDLAKKQDSLVRERKKLEQDLKAGEEDLQGLQESVRVLTEEKKKLTQPQDKQ